MIMGVNAEAMEPNAHHTAESCDFEDSASAVVRRESSWWSRGLMCSKTRKC